MSCSALRSSIGTNLNGRPLRSLVKWRLRWRRFASSSFAMSWARRWNWQSSSPWAWLGAHHGRSLWLLRTVLTGTVAVPMTINAVCVFGVLTRAHLSHTPATRATIGQHGAAVAAELSNKRSQAEDAGQRPLSGEFCSRHGPSIRRRRGVFNRI
jgi:hypothetical protein